MACTWNNDDNSRARKYSGACKERRTEETFKNKLFCKQGSFIQMGNPIAPPSRMEIESRLGQTSRVKQPRKHVRSPREPNPWNCSLSIAKHQKLSPSHQHNADAQALLRPTRPRLPPQCRKRSESAPQALATAHLTRNPPPNNKLHIPSSRWTRTSVSICSRTPVSLLQSYKKHI